jgi:hypothetical protein
MKRNRPNSDGDPDRIVDIVPSIPSVIRPSPFTKTVFLPSSRYRHFSSKIAEIDLFKVEE